MIQIHADPTVAADVDAASLPWDPSPAPGVDRRRIERLGGEVARLTSLVRYAAGTSFPPHVHGGGEEYLVLTGTFSDEHGDHGPGTYVRNGIGTRHSPASRDGCIILVKLWWMHPAEGGVLTVDTRDPAAWSPTPSGARLPLHRDAHERVDLIRIDPGARIELAHDGGIELFVVSGSIEVDAVRRGRWAWLRRPGSGTLVCTDSTGATTYIKRGHLARPPPLPT